MSKTKLKQCAIYTRASTDIQAEKEFSSCEAQEEKIRSFVKSQDNWQIAKVYTDAGYTGANTNRPSLQELLEDIKQNKIDIILSYKIDRLTRSPKDFYQLIKIWYLYSGKDFKEQNAYFYSIWIELATKKKEPKIKCLRAPKKRFYFLASPKSDKIDKEKIKI